MRTLLSFVLILVITSCKGRTIIEPDVPPGPVRPDGDGLTTPLGMMCSHLRALHCPEGDMSKRGTKTSTCFQTMTMAQNTAAIPIECVTQAPSREAVRACGDPNREITFTCVGP